MWGGIKARTHYKDLFRQWSSSQSLEKLRRKLYKEPRPWYLGWALHEHKHLLQDHQCARLISWSTTVLRLERDGRRKWEAYRYAQELFGVFVRDHKAGEDTFNAYFRLCEVGRDLTMAFRWHNFLLETNTPHPFTNYTWLLRIAAASPNDEAADDMAEAIMEVYKARFCSIVENTDTGDRVLVHWQPETEKDRGHLQEFFAAFARLRPRLTTADVIRFVDYEIPGRSGAEAHCTGTTLVAAAEPGAASLPTPSRHHVFPQLEAGVPLPAPTLRRPYLRDSLLDPSFLLDVQEAAFSHDVSRVIGLLKEYQLATAAERDKWEKRRQVEGDADPRGSRCRGGRDIWGSFSDPSAVAFREALVKSPGFPSELYHYLIVALTQVHPTMALRTKKQMSASGLRVQDLTRAVLIAAAVDSEEDQISLLREQWESIEQRRALDRDFGTTKEVELFWKFQYPDLLYYRNALSEREFLGLLMEGIGVRRTQALVLRANLYGDGPVEEAEAVVLSEPLRAAAAMHYRTCRGPAEVDAALDEITHHLPKLDISLVGSIPHLKDYTLREGEDVATDIASLAKKISGYADIYVLDSSFVESSESFLTLGAAQRAGEPQRRALALFPYSTLAQLAAPLEEEEAATIGTYDPALQDSVQGEATLASQRLRAIGALLQRGESTFVRFDVLHFSECLLGHYATAPDGGAAAGSAGCAPLDPATSDDDHLLLVAAMLRAISPSRSGTSVSLCTDDHRLIQRIHHPSLQALCHGIQVLTTQPSPHVVDVENNLVCDHPILDMNAVEHFEPTLDSTKCPAAHGAEGAGRAARVAPSDGTTGHSVGMLELNAESLALTLEMDAEEPPAAPSSTVPWLRLATELRDDDDSQPGNTDAITVSAQSVPSEQSVAVRSESGPVAAAEEALSSDEDAHQEKLMNLYSSPHSIIPVGVEMAEASTIGDFFSQFDSTGPDAFLQQELEQDTSKTPLAMGSSSSSSSGTALESGARKKVPQARRRLSLLGAEMRRNWGYSNRQRRELARGLSNASGGRVPMNFRYHVVDADITDPRNRHLLKAYEEGVARKRTAFKRDLRLAAPSPHVRHSK